MVYWTSDTAAAYGRVQYGTTSAYGSIYGDDQSALIGAGGFWTTNVTGLLPNTTYHVAGNVSTDAVTWCPNPTDTTFTTSPLPGGSHPVLPAPPATWDANTVAVPTGKVWLVSPLTCAGTPTWATLYGGTSCHDNTSDPGHADTLQHAIANSDASCNATYGDVIVLQKGTVVASPTNVYPNILTFADACDANGTMTAWNHSTGVFTTSAAHGLSAGNIIRMGQKNVFGTLSIDMPPPLQAGFPYCVLSNNLTTTTFTVGLTCGGSVVTGTASDLPANGCFITGASIPAESEILIRTSASDSQLPPQGVRIDSTYDSQLAIIRNASPLPTASSIVFDFGQGCLAHHYRFLGIRWDYTPVTSVGAPDTYMYLGMVISGFSSSHIILDRNRVVGSDYPDRTMKFWNPMDGAYMAFINGDVENMNGWTPSNTYQGTNSASGTATQTLSGTLYKGQSISTVCPNHPSLTITGGTSGSAVWEVSSDCTNNFILQTGLSATCTDSSGPACTVTTTAVPAFTVASSLYTRYPIASLTVSGGNVTGLSFLTETAMIQGGANNEGGLSFAINYGPGPTKIDNNYVHNGVGIGFYWTGDNSQKLSISCATSAGCLYLTPPSDAVISRNDVILDKDHMPNPANSSWNGRFYSGRQPGEFKEITRGRVVGNVISGSYCMNSVIRGPAYTISPLNNTGSLYISNQTIQDLEFGWNIFTNICDGFQMTGSYPAYIDQSILTQRLWIHDNTMFGVDKYTWVALNSIPIGSGNGEQMTFLHGLSDVTIEHNTFDVNRGPFPAQFTIACRNNEGMVIRNNFLSFSNDDNSNGAKFYPCAAYASTPDYGGQTAATAINNTWISSIWTSNWFLAGYSNSATLTDMTDAQVGTQVTNWSGLAGTNFVRSADTVASRTAAIKWRNHGALVLSPLNYQLTSASPYLSGGVNHASDGLDIGTDTDQQIVQHGTVQNARSRSVGQTGAIVSFVAPDSTGCTVDLSTDGLATWTRVLNAGGARVQDVTLSGLLHATLYAYRINCQVQQPRGSFTTLP